MANVSDAKKETVKEFVNLAKKYPIIAAVNMENLPGPQLQKMRATLRGKVVMRMTKRRIMRIVFDQVKNDKPGIEKLGDYLKGMPALLFTEENPFSLFRTINKNKSPAPAKEGQEAPNDIIIPAGPTPFSPGPVIGELGALGVKTKVEGGKIAVVSDSVVAKEGQKISSKLAGMLTRLGINPMEVGLDVTAVYEDGVIYTKSVLDVDEKEFMQNLSDAAGWALNLAIEVAYPAEETVELLLGKAFTQAKSVALESGFIADDIVDDLLAKAYHEGLSLKKEAKID